MPYRSRLLVTGLIAIASVAAWISTATANRLSVSSPRFTVTWAALRFTNPEASETTIRCPVTLEGSFHSATIRKVSNALVSFISRASVGTCSSGTVRVLTATLPWHIQYESFSGTLPAITHVRLNLIGAAFSWSYWLLCLYRTSAANPLPFEVTRNISTSQITGIVPDESAGIPSPDTFCGSYPAHLGGSGVVSVLGRPGEGIFLTLI
jgi:hypothetical protein